MRVLMLTGPDAVHGGHSTQRDRTASALASLGVEVVIRPRLFPRDRFDVVHAWWPERDQLRQARLRRIPIATSTIYIPLSTFAVLTASQEAVSRTRMGASGLRKGLMGRQMEMAEQLIADRTRRRLAFECSDLLLPNSVGEAELIEGELGVTTPSWVVRNGVDPAIYHQRGAEPWSKRSGVLIAARIEPHKGQLKVIQAAAGSGIKLYVAGGAHPDHGDYYRRCLAAARKAGNVEMTGRLDPRELGDLMRRVRVHVLPSQWETTGLCSLEAAACGCNVVVTDRGHVREYLRNDATYCTLSVADIRRAILSSHAQPSRSRLHNRVARAFTWHHAAADTLAAYEWLVSVGRSNLDGERLSHGLARLDG